MEIYIPNLKTEIESVRVIFDEFSNKLVCEGIPTDRLNIYQVAPPEIFHYYSIELNGKFRVCDAWTDESFLLKNGEYGTVSVQKDISNQIFIKSVLCTKVNAQGIAEELTNIFTDENPMVILSFELISPSSNEMSAVVTVEWCSAKQTQWITSRPYRFKGKKVSFNALRISREIPEGSWSCHVYVNDEFASMHSFVIVRGQLKPNAAFFDSYG
ncbi:hypothetical protein [Sulfoacidibacillus thermotolerans]|uniref:Uncharacterized protein n=1 Tax=Sulfoacidibacillus thermotolerans TaxID=1765684 RepID=A0A2U3D6D8_SULT2|nr:hypothetical protein [Sulfoacidibacillus thermotolerans]PWI56834.1 hypothetical protein BM613_11835 [Sulfoacidibacillus thermotolerans]PWI58259.1 hypothetical protein BM613_04915 [Sulfoacidibacillus thermotolerans]